MAPRSAESRAADVGAWRSDVLMVACKNRQDPRKLSNDTVFEIRSQTFSQKGHAPASTGLCGGAREQELDECNDRENGHEHSRN